ncbi:hypothetical protein EGH82_15265 [Vibrio ponticus]|uniref:Outer membrane protein beta-barrel domain-containing protein n=1 Tax=Vibrio ponticus TaxID=265668 RepID=A0A3N3DXF8_9VIBR|nr:outer membrane beta-barrel protein [Vibrio ponticus]ROV59086.1 hypothetical protein EGH82_15265 [Vibrio ponticus]
MHKTLSRTSQALLIATLAMPFTLQAAEDHQDKSGHTIQVGFAELFGDLSEGNEGILFSLGYDYTNRNGIILGGYYKPELISGSGSYAGVGISLESDVLGFYSGYQINDNFRLTGGFSLTFAEIVMSTAYGFVSDSETNVGLNLGFDFLVNNLVVGSRLDTHDIYGVEGTTVTFNLGFKF